MDLRLQFLESFAATGSDGQAYKVCAYDRLARAEGAGGLESWESTGQVEYRLADGRLVDVARDRTLRVNGSEIELKPENARYAPA
ncbi:hypothetical protein JI739_14940 [Ramlibacter sp. AW1]|uniref:Uncharacterized protein n=1 Tax=Ramlibacter aurantiacus TaxID=2801330 RepID=A0A936ZQ29_9BURK|nr:hypothetical protein [Ramlibacter aurantiacus]MBL0421651.1 hypothetical protein [Ramlibacter aurantiacus]